MASLPVISGREAVKAFQKLGFLFHHQRGSHIILYHPNGRHLQFQITGSSIGNLEGVDSRGGDNSGGICSAAVAADLRRSR
jgi:hypothetical protein